MQQSGGQHDVNRMVNSTSPPQHMNIYRRILIIGVIFSSNYTFITLFFSAYIHLTYFFPHGNINMTCEIYNICTSYGYYSLYSVNKSVSMAGGFRLNSTDVSSRTCNCKEGNVTAVSSERRQRTNHELNWLQRLHSLTIWTHGEAEAHLHSCYTVTTHSFSNSFIPLKV